MRSVRAGFSIIELMVVLTISAIVLSIAATWIHQSLSAASVMRDRSQHHQSLMRFSRVLRDHVHAAQSVSITPDAVLVAEQGDGSQASFRIVRGAIEMLQESPGRMSRDRFPIEDSDFAHWDATELPDWVGFVVHRRAERVGAELMETGLTENREPKAASSIDDSYSQTLPVELHLRIATRRLDRLGLQQGASE